MWTRSGSKCMCTMTALVCDTGTSTVPLSIVHWPSDDYTQTVNSKVHVTAQPDRTMA